VKGAIDAKSETKQPHARFPYRMFRLAPVNVSEESSAELPGHLADFPENSAAITRQGNSPTREPGVT